MSGRPKPGRGDEAEQLRELTREAREAAKDLRAEIRAAREVMADVKEAFGAVLQAHYDETHAAIQASYDHLANALKERERECVMRAAASVPVRVACSWCGCMVAAMMDLTGEEFTRVCPECGNETTMQLVDGTQRGRMSALLAAVDAKISQAGAAAIDVIPLVKEAVEQVAPDLPVLIDSRVTKHRRPPR